MHTFNETIRNTARFLDSLDLAYGPSTVLYVDSHMVPRIRTGSPLVVLTIPEINYRRIARFVHVCNTANGSTTWQPLLGNFPMGTLAVPLGISCSIFGTKEPVRVILPDLIEKLQTLALASY